MNIILKNKTLSYKIIIEFIFYDVYKGLLLHIIDKILK